MITGRQIRAARGLLNWDASELAAKAGLTRETVSKIENETVQARETTLHDIVHTFNNNGVEFLGNIGVQWIQHQSQTLVGVNGLKTFFDDVRFVAQHTDQEIVICGFDEDYFEKKLGEYLDHHRKEMTKYGNVKMRCLIEESDLNIGASDYCRYRWQSSKYFSSVPFYIYGDKIAIIATASPEDPLILLIKNRSISEAYRNQFEAMWGVAKELPKTIGERS